MYQRHRNLVTRADGKLVNVARFRGQLFVCHDNCCCGRTEDGIPAVPVELYNAEWERRHLRNIVHLTVGGCLGPCALANVALLVFDGHSLWFHSMNTEPLVRALYDYIEAMLDADGLLPPPPALAPYHFTAAAWQPRPDGQPVQDRRLWRGAEGDPPHAQFPSPSEGEGAGVRVGDPEECPLPTAPVDRLVAQMDGAAAAPRKNGELVFEEPWQGRAFGMAIALHDQERYTWDEFRDNLIAQIAEADAAGASLPPSAYYERWLASFEVVLTAKGLVTPEEIEERTSEFEFGERDDVF